MKSCWGRVSRGYKWSRGMFWSGSAWEKLPKSSRTWVSFNTLRLLSAGLGKAWDGCGNSRKPLLSSGDNDGHHERLDPPSPLGSHVCFR